jgi:hypothetical protein
MPFIALLSPALGAALLGKKSIARCRTDMHALILNPTEGSIGASGPGERNKGNSGYPCQSGDAVQFRSKPFITQQFIHS